ncbi:MAG: isoprenylcysteine carboxylmethyltransferase family protein [Myxococcales bacterium]|nr:isoprenylcysteine carboxylmethyltransferase family protein [Myxococcales bacterium]
MKWIHLALLGGFLLFVFTAGLLRSWRVWRLTGVNPLRLGSSQSPHDYIGRWFLRVILLLFGLLVASVATSAPIGLLGPLPALDRFGVKLAGLVAIGVALVWTLVAQSQMGASWRIGIDRDHPTPLVTHGLFRRFRNPIFLGMLVALHGLTVALASVASLALLVFGFVLLQIQVRLEEEHLLGQHGERYRQYLAGTRRWV